MVNILSKKFIKVSLKNENFALLHTDKNIAFYLTCFLHLQGIKLTRARRAWFFLTVIQHFLCKHKKPFSLV